MPQPNLSKWVLLFCVAAYGFTNFLLAVLSFVTTSQARARVKAGCTVGDALCGTAAWTFWPMLAAAAAICVTTTSVMISNIHIRTKKIGLDPLYVFRGIFFTLLILTPVVVAGWIRPMHTHFAEHEIGVASSSHPLFKGEPSSWSLNETSFLGFVHHRGVFYSGDVEDLTDVLRYIKGGYYGSFVGYTGALILRQVADLPGASTVALAHFNVIFGAMIAGIATALAPPARILVGANGLNPNGGAAA